MSRLILAAFPQKASESNSWQATTFAGTLFAATTSRRQRRYKTRRHHAHGLWFHQEQQGMSSRLSRIPRRRFLKGAAAAAGALAWASIPRNVLGANERLNIAGIGAN